MGGECCSVEQKDTGNVPVKRGTTIVDTKTLKNNEREGIDISKGWYTEGIYYHASDEAKRTLGFLGESQEIKTDYKGEGGQVNIGL